MKYKFYGGTGYRKIQTEEFYMRGSKGRRVIAAVLAITILFSMAFTGIPAGTLTAQAAADGTSGNPYIIETAEQFNAVRNDTSAHYKLASDIDLTEFLSEGGAGYAKWGASGWLPIGNNNSQFTGSLDGAGYKITGIWICGSADLVGLFGCIGTNGSVSDLGIEESEAGINGYSYVGGVAGYNTGTIQNCYNTGAVSATGYVGGVAGFNIGTIQNCYNIGAVSGEGYVGGVAGWNYGTNAKIANCYNTGAVNGTGNFVGSVAGRNDGTIQNCYNTGAVSGNSNVGGVAGYNNSGTIENCYNTGAVNGDGNVGGVAGQNSGKNAKIQNCYNTGTVSGNSQVGGVAGRNSGTIQNCYNTGAVSGNENVGGVAGDNYYGTIQNCYYNTDNYNGNAIGGGTGSGDMTGGLSTAQMTANNVLTDSDGMSGLGGAFVKPDYLNTSNGCATAFYPELAIFADSEDDFTKAMSKISVAADGDCTLGTNEEYFAHGDGTVADPYKIYTAKQLNHVRQHLNKSFILMTDINLAGWNAAETDTGNAQTDGKGWEPIGNNSTSTSASRFTGSFDGAGHKITGLWINRESTDYVGLFGYIGAGGSVSGLGVKESAAGISGNGNVGGIAGYNQGTIANCYNTGAVSGNYSVGGVAGFNYGTIQNCYNTGAVGGNGNNVGGVAGWNNRTITNCYNTGAVTGTGNVGGVAGVNGSGSTIQNCYNTGAVSGNGNNVGGVAGFNGGGTIANCYNTGAVSGNSYYVGGVAGYNDSGTIQNCYNTGAVSGYSNVGGVAGYSNNTIANCYYNTENYTGNAIGGEGGSVSNVEGLNTAKMTGINALNNMNGFTDTVWKTSADEIHGCCGGFVFYPQLKVFAESEDKNTADMSRKSITVTKDTVPGEALFTEGSGSSENPWKITTAEQLNHVRRHLNGHFKMQEDINLSDLLSEGKPGYNDGKGWEPIGTDYDSRFTGSFNGAGYKITGLWINRTDADYVGLFGYIGRGGSVSNLGVKESAEGINGYESVGGVAGFNGSGSTIQNCYNTGAVSGNGNVGGVVGYNSGTIQNCYNTGAVKGNGSVGGVAGLNNNTIQNCYNTGVVNGNTYNVGGVAGYNSGTIQNCCNTGTVKGTGNVGGVAGQNNIGTITDCYNTGAVTQTGSGSNVGGIAGWNTGTNAKIANCYNTGAVSGTTNVGGVAGYNSGTIQNSYNIGAVNGNSSVGGVAGQNSGENAKIANCYYNTNNYNGNAIGEGTGSGDKTGGLTTAQMTGAAAKTTMTGFDFSDVWTTANAADCCGTVTYYPQLIVFAGSNDKDTADMSRESVTTTTGTAIPDGEEVFTEGDGSSDDPWKITTAEQLNHVRRHLDGHFVMEKDIDLSEFLSENGAGYNGVAGWQPIGAYASSSRFTGSLDGAGYEITGLWIKRTDMDYIGLFGCIGTNGSVSNLGVKESAAGINGRYRVGGVTGYSGGTITNCYNTGAVTQTGTASSGYVGGVAGENTGGTIENCYNTGKVTGNNSYVGGVAGSNSSGGTIKDCRNTGEVSVNGNFVGGVVGINSDTIQNCTNTGTVTGIESMVGGNRTGGGMVGGVAGDNSGTIRNCRNTGAVNGAGDFIGGVAGRSIGSTAKIISCHNNGTVTQSVNVNRSSNYVGGIAGSNSGTIENCYNYGAVSGKNYVGGIAGQNIRCTMQNCYNTGAVTAGNIGAGGDYAGGIAGRNYDGGIMQNCYSSGAVSRFGSGTGNVGGIAGQNANDYVVSEITNCYYNIEKYNGGAIGGGNGDVNNAVGLTTAQMTGTAALGNMTGFTDDVWKTSADEMNDCCGGFAFYPQLKVFADDENTADMSRESVTTTTDTAVPDGEEVFTEGDGTSGNPWKINTAEQLNHVRSHLNGHFKMQDDIDLTDFLTEGGAGWEPIGTSASRFTGSFNGAGYKITGLWINRGNMDYVGLFGYIGAGGSISNLGVKESTAGISGRLYVGGVVGINYGTIENCHNTGAVSGSSIVGGVAGRNNGTITNCCNTGEVSSRYDYVGGVAGYNYGTIENCYNTGEVTGTNSVGGVVGVNDGTNAKIQNCYNIGAVSGTGNNFGGVTGYNSGTITNCYNTGAISGTDDVGGVAGYNYGTIQNCYNTGEVTGTNSVGGVAGYNYGGTIANCYNTGSVGGTGNYAGGVAGYNSSNSTIQSCYYNKGNYIGNAIGYVSGTISNTGGLNTAQMTGINAQTTMTGFDFTNLWKTVNAANCCDTTYYPQLRVFADSEDENTADMSLKSVIATMSRAVPEGEEVFTEGGGIIGNPWKIYTAKQLNHVRSHLDGHFEMQCDIDLTEFLTVGNPGYNNGAGWLPIGTSGSQFTGSLDGAGHKITGLWISRGSTSYVGLFGYIGTDGSISDLGVEESAAGINGYSYVGGVAGQNFGTIENCYNTGAVTGTGGSVGGVAGSNGGTIQNCHNTGAVSGNDRVGGVAGQNSGTIENCYNTGAVSGNGSNVGGVAGFNNSGTIENCYNTGAVSGNGSNVGGVAGYNLGYDGTATITSCYNTGTVSGNGNEVGGVAGDNNAVFGGTAAITDCYWNTDTYDGDGIGTDPGTTASVTGLPTEQMTADDVLSGDMSGLGNAWVKRDNDNDFCYYPELSVFYKETPETKREIASMISVRVPRVVISVIVEWGAMEFTYKDATAGTWNPETHQYDGASPAGWTCNDNGNLIKVTNNSTEAVSVSFDYVAKTDYDGISGKFEDAGGEELPDPVTLPVSQTAEAYLKLTGIPDAVLPSTKIGTVTVTVN